MGQLARDLRDKALITRVFEPFGVVESLRWLQEKGIAYVQFMDFEPARAAVATLDAKYIPGVSLERGLNVKFSEKR